MMESHGVILVGQPDLDSDDALRLFHQVPPGLPSGSSILRHGLRQPRSSRELRSVLTGLRFLGVLAMALLPWLVFFRLRIYEHVLALILGFILGIIVSGSLHSTRTPDGSSPRR